MNHEMTEDEAQNLVDTRQAVFMPYGMDEKFFLANNGRLFARTPRKDGTYYYRFMGGKERETKPAGWGFSD